MNLFNTVILVTAAVAVVLLVKLAFGNRITPRGHMLMWILVAASVLAVPLAEILPESDFSGVQYNEEEMLVWGIRLLLERLGGRHPEPQHYFQKPVFHEGKTIGQVSNQ